MKPKNGIKIRFQRAAANTNPQMDKVVLEDVLTAYKKTLGRKLISPQLKIWRIIKKSRITKLAVAAAIIIAALIGAYHQLTEGRSKDISTSPKSGLNTSARPYGRNTNAKREFRLGASSIAQVVARSSVIVRARFLEKTDTGRHQGGLILSKWKMDVIKVIYGKVSGQTIEVMYWHDPESQKEGREVIMCLRMIEGQIYGTTTYYGSLDSREKAILEVIESGAHLTAPTVGTRW